MLQPSRYRFHSLWDLQAPPAVVYDVLARAEEYPLWWPQVREVVPVDDRTGRARFRSVLPYDLLVTASETHRDPGAGVLQIAMSGDLVGWARFTVLPHPGGARAVFEQEVRVTKLLMRVLALPARPVFRANHAWMMRGGRRGLRTLLTELM